MSRRGEFNYGAGAAEATGRCARVCLVACLSALASPALADEQPVAEIVVTGTRITLPGRDSASPSLVVPEQAFEESPYLSVERTLNTFPQFAPTSTGTSNDPSADGQATVSLRGLGPMRTLVLLDGRRLTSSDGVGQVDVNLLPPQLIDTVEVITGGASAVYGSDAVAGVVNFRLRDSYSGIGLTGLWSQSWQGDGDEYQVGLIAGTPLAEGRGSIMAYVGYSRRDGITQDARDFSRRPLKYYADETNGIGPGKHFLSSDNGVVDDGLGIVWAAPPVFDTLFESYGYAAGTVPYQPTVTVNADGTVFTTGATATGIEVPGGVANYRGEPDPLLSLERSYTSNYAPYTALQMPLDRWSGFLGGKFVLTDQAELYGQFLYGDYSVQRQLSPTPAGIALVPVTSPYVTPDLAQLLASRSDPAAPFRYFKLTTAVGPRIADNDRTVLQGTLGVRGQIAGWNYDVYALAGRNERTEQQSGNVSLSRLEELTFAPDGGIAICGGFPVFGKTPIPAACADYIAVDASNKARLEQFIAEASVEGELLALPAGPIGIAAGVFYKHSAFSYRSDPALKQYLPAVPGVIGPRADVAGFAAGADRSGSDSNTDLYVEALLPLLRDVIAVRALDLGLGYRYSDYQQAGGVDTYKADLVYQPVDRLRLQGSYQRAVRAPSVEELYYPALSGQFVVEPPDPCSTNSAERNGPDRAQVEALCQAQGMSPELLATFVYPLARVEGVSGGNPDLSPEKADTYTVGISFNSPSEAAAWRDLQVSLDHYWITVNDVIGVADARTAVDRCYDRRYNPGYSPGNAYCGFFRRDPESGEIFALLLNSNLGTLETTGTDLQVDWGVPIGPGRASANLYVTHVDTWQVTDPGGAASDYAGTIGGSSLGSAVPQWKWQMRLGYQWSSAEGYARWRYIDGMHDVRYPNFEVPATNYFDAGASYAFNDGPMRGLMLRAGVDNLLDEQPPVYPTYQQANTEPALYDVLGRRYYVSADWKF